MLRRSSQYNKHWLVKNSITPPDPIQLLLLFLRERVSTPGIFTVEVCPSKVKTLTTKLKKKGTADLSEYDVHTCAKALVGLLDTLQEPLLTFSFCTSFITAASVDESEESRLWCIREVLDKLPIANRATLNSVMQVLREVKEEKLNCVGEEELAGVFAPVLFKRPPSHPPVKLPSTLFNSTKSTSSPHSLIAICILHHDVLFKKKGHSVPKQFLPQQEYLYHTLKGAGAELAVRKLELGDTEQREPPALDQFDESAFKSPKGKYGSQYLEVPANASVEDVWRSFFSPREMSSHSSPNMQLTRNISSPQLGDKKVRKTKSSQQTLPKDTKTCEKTGKKEKKEKKGKKAKKARVKSSNTPVPLLKLPSSESRHNDILSAREVTSKPSHEVVYRKLKTSRNARPSVF